MTIGQKIKELRTKHGLTQEKLADYLCISYQAVSKWENDASAPDLSMIGPLTKVFQVSADELLCLNASDHDDRYNELQKAYDHTYDTEDFAKRQEICETAVAEYPGDMRFLCNLAWVVSNRSFEHEDQNKFVAQQEKAIKLFDSVIRNCGDDSLRTESIDGITQLLGWRGRQDEAIKYASMLPEKERKRVWENCLTGEELIKFKQDRLLTTLEGIIWDLSLLPTGEVYTDLIEKMLKTMFPDGNYILFNHHLFYAYQKSVNHELKINSVPDTDCIMTMLKKMAQAAKRYDAIAYDNPGVYRYTASWCDRIEADSREWLGREGSRMCADMTAYLNDRKFDFMRLSDGFTAIYGMIQS